MERKPLEMMKELQRKNAELEKTKKRLEYQIQEMIAKSSQRSAEMDQKITELEIRIRDLEYENRELKSDKKVLARKLADLAPSTTETGNVIDLDSNEEDTNEEELEDNEPQNLLEPLPSQNNISHYGEQRGLPFSCHLCSKSYLYQKRLETHMKVHQMAAKNGMIKAQVQTQQQQQQQQAQSNEGEKKKLLHCSFKNCKYTTTFYPVLVRHKKTHTSEMLSCDFYMCDYKTPYRKRYYNHMASKHGASMTGADVKMDNLQDDDDDADHFRAFEELNNMISSSNQDGN